MLRQVALLCVFACLPMARANADSLDLGGKLLLTRGITSIEGPGGGGLTPWALITGNETERGVGASAHYAFARVNDFDLRAYGAAVGFYDRVELSYTRQEFDTRAAGATLGLGDGFVFKQDIFGAKLRLFGDAVYDQDRILPQIAVGVAYKRSNQEALVTALGADSNDGVDIYVSATKLVLSQSLLLNATLRYTRANQLGLLGFSDSGSVQPEFSVGYLVSRRFLVGGEYRFKPDRLAFAEEDDAFDIFGAFAVNDHITVTAAYVDIGDVATFNGQRGVYLSAQMGF